MAVYDRHFYFEIVILSRRKNFAYFDCKGDA